MLAFIRIAVNSSAYFINFSNNKTADELLNWHMPAGVQPNSELLSLTIKLKFYTKWYNAVCHLHNSPPLNHGVMRFPKTKLMSVHFSRQAVSKRQNSYTPVVMHTRWHFAWSPVSHEAHRTKGSKTAIKGSYYNEPVKVRCSPGFLR
jgi:hypothetical protein